MIKIKIDKDKCIGCGTCASLMPDTFELGEDGKAKAIKTEVDEKEIQEVIESCPAGAISVIAEDQSE